MGGRLGELEGEPLAAPLLLGMGLDEFSMGVASIPVVKQEIRKWTLSGAQALLDDCLQLDDGSDVRHFLQANMP